MLRDKKYNLDFAGDAEKPVTIDGNANPYEYRPLLIHRGDEADEDRSELPQEKQWAGYLDYLRQWSAPSSAPSASMNGSPAMTDNPKRGGFSKAKRKRRPRPI